MKEPVPPPGFGEIPDLPSAEGSFRLPTAKEMSEGLGPNFNPYPIEFDPASLDRGYSGWVSSEDEGGPDVGHFIGLGGGAWLWIGEIPDAEHDALSEDHKAIGDAGGWRIVMHTPSGERLALGKAVAGYGGDTSEFIECLCSTLRQTGSAKQPTPRHPPARP